MGNKNQPLHVVGAILLRGDRILVARRASHKSAAGLWEFPGGKVESGELPADALIREIQEEMTLAIEPLKTFDVSDTIVNDAAIRLEVIVCRVVGDFSGVSSDHDEFLWVDPSGLAALTWALPDLPAVQLLKGVNDFSLLDR